MKYIKTCAFILIKDNKILAEKRKLSKAIDPGKIVIPGGHIGKDESPRTACIRELKEELNLTPDKTQFVCTLLHKVKDDTLKIHYFIIPSWTGDLQNNEADEILWIPLHDLSKLSLEVDKIAINEWTRMFKN